MRVFTNRLRSSHSLVVIACFASLLAMPAAASGHGYYDMYDPDATAPDGHYVVSISWPVVTVVDGFASGQMMGIPACLWSDGTVDNCEGLADWW